MLSAVAGITRNGKMDRVVVTSERFEPHLQPGERAYPVPDLRVQEPVEWNAIPALIKLVQEHINRRPNYFITAD